MSAPAVPTVPTDSDALAVAWLTAEVRRLRGDFTITAIEADGVRATLRVDDEDSVMVALLGSSAAVRAYATEICSQIVKRGYAPAVNALVGKRLPASLTVAEVTAPARHEEEVERRRRQ